MRSATWIKATAAAMARPWDPQSLSPQHQDDQQEEKCAGEPDLHQGLRLDLTVEQRFSHDAGNPPKRRRAHDRQVPSESFSHARARIPRMNPINMSAPDVSPNAITLRTAGRRPAGESSGSRARSRCQVSPASPLAAASR